MDRSRTPLPTPVPWRARGSALTGIMRGEGHPSHRASSRPCSGELAARTRSVAGRFRLEGDVAQRSDEVGPQRFTNDVGLVDTVTIGALLEQIRELVIQPGVDRG
jgi:hypothetical protein